jgi:hypothetical protein
MIPGGAVRVVEAVSQWNNGAGVSSPSRRGPLGRSRRASGVQLSLILQSSELCSSVYGHGCEGYDLAMEVLSSRSALIAVRYVLSLMCRSWRWCCAALVIFAGWCYYLFRWVVLLLVQGC